MPIILIIDDEEKLRTLLARIISLEGYTVLQAGSLKAGIKILQKETVDLLLCDVKLPDGNGVDFVKLASVDFPQLETILLTAYGNISDGVQAIKNGAFDYITKGDDNDRILPLLYRALEKVQLKKKIVQLESKIQKQYGFDAIIGVSVEIQEAIVMAKKVAQTDAGVLLLGETGTGKEVFAQAIHYGSKRNSKPFQAVNCSAISKDLLESELFGYKAGAFTGANKDKKGLIQEADQGTLFLDEIGDMPLELQAKLLRVLENHSFIKVGGTESTKVDVRIIAATNRNLTIEVQNGTFREDLFYRINLFTINLPALRHRKKDIPLLAEHYLTIFGAKVNTAPYSMDKEFLEHLKSHQWKGNIRELKNVMERAIILSNRPILTLKDLPLDFKSNDPRHEINVFELAQMEKLHIQKVLKHCSGNKTETAKLLGIGIATLYRKIEEYKI